MTSHVLQEFSHRKMKSNGHVSKNGSKDVADTTASIEVDRKRRESREGFTKETMSNRGFRIGDISPGARVQREGGKEKRFLATQPSKLIRA